MDKIKAVQFVKDTEIIVLARVLELLEEHPTLAKKIIRQRYDELRKEVTNE